MTSKKSSSNNKQGVQSMQDVVCHPDTVNVSKDIGEIGIDAFIKNDILKEIPFIKSFLGIYGIVDKVDEYFFTKKLTQLLFEINEVSPAVRASRIKEINESENVAGNVGERLLETLKRIESNNKPKLVGKLFRAVLKKNIDYKDFLRLCHIINLTYFDDLFWLYQHSDGNYVDDNLPEPISFSELVTSSLGKAFEGSIGPEDNWTGKVYLTKLGKALVEYGF